MQVDIVPDISMRFEPATETERSDSELQAPEIWSIQWFFQSYHHVPTILSNLEPYCSILVIDEASRSSTLRSDSVCCICNLSP